MHADLPSSSPPFLFGVLRTLLSWVFWWLTPGDAIVTALKDKLGPATEHYFLTEDGARHYPDQWGRTSLRRRYYRSDVRVLLKADDREITYFKLDAKKLRLILAY